MCVGMCVTCRHLCDVCACGLPGAPEHMEASTASVAESPPPHAVPGLEVPSSRKVKAELTHLVR